MHTCAKLHYSACSGLFVHKQGRANRCFFLRCDDAIIFIFQFRKAGLHALADKRSGPERPWTADSETWNPYHSLWEPVRAKKNSSVQNRACEISSNMVSFSLLWADEELLLKRYCSKFNESLEVSCWRIVSLEGKRGPLTLIFKISFP